MVTPSSIGELWSRTGHNHLSLSKSLREHMGFSLTNSFLRCLLSRRSVTSAVRALLSSNFPRGMGKNSILERPQVSKRGPCCSLPGHTPGSCYRAHTVTRSPRLDQVCFLCHDKNGTTIKEDLKDAVQAFQEPLIQNSLLCSWP